MTSSQVSQRVITEVGGNGESGALFLKSFIPTGSFWKIIIPLANNIPTLGQSTWIISHTPCKPCTTHVTCISLEQLTESPTAFIMYSVVSVTSNNTSNSNWPESLHNFIENMCYCYMTHCRHFLTWQRKLLPYLAVSKNPNNNICILPFTCINCFIYSHQNIFFPTQYLNLFNVFSYQVGRQFLLKVKLSGGSEYTLKNIPDFGIIYFENQ
jgi:hypothetical protein